MSALTTVIDMGNPSHSDQSSSRRLAVIMDPIQSIKPQKDSTLAMLLAAQARGWTIHCGEMKDIWIRDGEAFARLTSLTVADDSEHWYETGNVQETALGDIDVILMRKDPPLDMEYVQATYILQRAEESGSLIVNQPSGIRDVNEKTFVSWFPQCCPPTLISRSIADLQKFVDERDRSVLKPLNDMGGWSVFVTSPNDGNLNVMLELLTRNGRHYIMAQEYIDAIGETGDKRILLIDGEPVPYALARIPDGGDHRGNLACGARAEGRELTDRDRWICDQVGPVLRDRGILFAGIDVIGDYLTEINITSPTCIRELDRIYDLNAGAMLMDAIESKLKERSDSKRNANKRRHNDVLGS